MQAQRSARRAVGGTNRARAPPGLGRAVLATVVLALAGLSRADRATFGGCGDGVADPECCVAYLAGNDGEPAVALDGSVQNVADLAVTPNFVLAFTVIQANSDQTFPAYGGIPGETSPIEFPKRLLFTLEAAGSESSVAVSLQGTRVVQDEGHADPDSIRLHVELRQGSTTTVVEGDAGARDQIFTLNQVRPLHAVIVVKSGVVHTYTGTQIENVPQIDVTDTLAGAATSLAFEAGTAATFALGPRTPPGRFPALQLKDVRLHRGPQADGTVACLSSATCSDVPTDLAFGGDLGFCYSTKGKRATTEFDAAKECADSGARLCTWEEIQEMAQRGFPFPLSSYAIVANQEMAHPVTKGEVTFTALEVTVNRRKNTTSIVGFSEACTPGSGFGCEAGGAGLNAKEHQEFDAGLSQQDWGAARLCCADREVTSTTSTTTTSTSSQTSTSSSSSMTTATATSSSSTSSTATVTRTTATSATATSSTASSTSRSTTTTLAPTGSPTSEGETFAPTAGPSAAPTPPPTQTPTRAGDTFAPTVAPSPSPTRAPTAAELAGAGAADADADAIDGGDAGGGGGGGGLSAGAAVGVTLAVLAALALLVLARTRADASKGGQGGGVQAGAAAGHAANPMFDESHILGQTGRAEVTIDLGNHTYDEVAGGDTPITDRAYDEIPDGLPGLAQPAAKGGRSWDVGGMPDKECTELVRSAQPGQFLVRTSGRGARGTFVICVNTGGGRACKVPVKPAADGRQLQFAERLFADLVSIVEYWRHHQLSPVRGVSIKLTTAAPLQRGHRRVLRAAASTGSQVIVSHHEDDHLAAEQLVTLLEGAGFLTRPIGAQRGLSPRQLQAALRGAVAAIVCITPRSLESGSVAHQHRRAVLAAKKEHGKDLFIVKLGADDAVPPRCMVQFNKAKWYNPLESAARADELFADMRHGGVPSESSYAEIHRGVKETAYGAIMASYAWGSQDPMTGKFPAQEKVLMFKQAMERRGHRMWMDKDHMRGDLGGVMRTVVERCSVFVACITDDYYRAGSNAQLEFEHALSTRSPGADMIVVKIDPRADTSGALKAMERVRPTTAGSNQREFDLSSTGNRFEAAVDGLVAAVPSFGSARRQYQSAGGEYGAVVQEVYTALDGSTSGVRHESVELAYAEVDPAATAPAATHYEQMGPDPEAAPYGALGAGHTQYDAVGTPTGVLSGFAGDGAEDTDGEMDV